MCIKCMLVCVCVRERERERGGGALQYRTSSVFFTETVGNRTDAEAAVGVSVGYKYNGAWYQSSQL